MGEFPSCTYFKVSREIGVQHPFAITNKVVLSVQKLHNSKVKSEIGMRVVGYS